MFDYNEFSINENLEPSIGDYVLVKSNRGNYYRHKDYKKPLPKEWIIESDGFISVNDDVNISNQNFKNIPFLFKKVSGFFSCWNCTSLTSLEGSPVSVESSFYCWGCTSLTSLKGCPKSVGGDFECNDCRTLLSIDYFKCIVNGKIYADDKIISGLVNIQNLYRQYPLLSKIEDNALFVHTVIGYAPELEQYYKEIPELPEHHQELSTFL